MVIPIVSMLLNYQHSSEILSVEECETIAPVALEGCLFVCLFEFKVSFVTVTDISRS